MVLSSITTFCTFFNDGRSYITSISDPSKIERNPRAPVLRAMAFLAIAANAPGRTSNSDPSIPSKAWYCLTKAFLGSVRICTNAVSSNWVKVANTGKRPISSGIKPNLIKSSGSTSFNSSPIARSSLPATSALKPMPDLAVRCWITFSKPSNAPPQINKILVVSTWRKSWLGCFLPPWGGIEAIVPSINLSKACCTPSPETSRVIDGLSDLREILSISSI